MSNIPSLDLNDFLSNDKTRKDAFVKSVGKAYQEIGFLSLKNHFLSKDNVENLYEQIKSFLEKKTETQIQLETNTQNNLIYGKNNMINLRIIEENNKNILQISNNLNYDIYLKSLTGINGNNLTSLLNNYDYIDKYNELVFNGLKDLNLYDSKEKLYNNLSNKLLKIEKNSTWVNILDMKETNKLESLIAGNNDQIYSNNDINIIENSGGRKVLTINYVKNRNLEERVNKATTCWAINKTYSNIFEHKLNLF